MIKAVILDCDGVILDSNKAYEKMYEVLFKKYGLKKTAKEIYPHFGESPKHMMDVFFKGRKDIKLIYRDYVKSVKSKSVNKGVKIHPGARLSIWKMSKKYKMALVSGAMHVRLHNTTTKFKIKEYFKSVLGSDDVKHAKPSPEALLLTLKRLKIKRNEAIFVGDAPNDLLAAKRARIKFVAVLTGVLNKKTAEKLKADYIISDITKVEKLIERMNQT